MILSYFFLVKLQSGDDDDDDDDPSLWVVLAYTVFDELSS